MSKLYDSPPQQLRGVNEDVQAGLDPGDRCVSIVDDRTADEVLAGLSPVAIDVDAARASHRLALIAKRHSRRGLPVRPPLEPHAAEVVH
jgi:hypothetical protein